MQTNGSITQEKKKDKPNKMTRRIKPSYRWSTEPFIYSTIPDLLKIVFFFSLHKFTKIICWFFFIIKNRLIDQSFDRPAHRQTNQPTDRDQSII